MGVIFLFLLFIALSWNVEPVYSQVGSGPPTYTFTCDFLNQDPLFWQNLTLPESLRLTKITYSCDVVFQEEEFFHLFDIPLHQLIDVRMLERVINHLYNKNKFSFAQFSFYPVQNGYELHVALEGFWTFDRVKFYGLARGADRYRHLYLIEPGERFTFEKHQHSLKIIEKSIGEEGYFSKEIFDYFKYNAATKTVTPYVILNPGKKFYIHRIEITLQGNEADQYYLKYLKKIKGMCKNSLETSAYNHQNLIRQLVVIKKYLQRQGFFDSSIKISRRVNYEQAGICLILNIELPKKKCYRFFGNHFFSKRQLFDHIASFGVAINSMPDSIICQELKQLYQNKGFINAIVQARKTDEGYCFLIQEGMRATIKQLEVVGNSFFSSIDLIAQIKKNIRSCYVDADEIKDTLLYLHELYNKKGFWQVKINEELIPVGGNLNNYILRFTIDEGAQYFLRNVRLASGWEQTPLCLLEKLDQEVCFFDISFIASQRQKLIDCLHRQGYIYAQVNHEVMVVDEEKYIFDLVWHIDKAESVLRFDKVIFQGSYTFPFSLLLKEMAFTQGSIWRPELLQESRANLARYGIFETIHLYPYKIATPQEYKPVLVKLVEDDPFEIRTRIGFQQVSRNLTFRKGTTYKLGGSFLWKNPSNAADCMQIDGDITRFYRNISAEYRRPWLAHEPILTVIKGYTNKYIQPIYIGSDKPLYQATQQGLLLGLRRRWLHLDVGITAGNEWMETNHLSNKVAHAINFEPALIDKKVPYVFLEPNVVFNYLDNQLNPSGGLLTIISAKMMIPWQKLNPKEGFFKILFDQAIFYSPLPPLVLGFRLRFGHIFNKDFNRIMPPERFYLGGQNSIRSYEPDFGPPLGFFIDSDGKKQFVPRGGRTMIAINVESRIMVWRSLGMVLFQDLGTLVDALKGNKARERILAATGFGLRYNTPIGPVRFDIGWKWHRCHEHESRYAWFLTLGHAF